MSRRILTSYLAAVALAIGTAPLAAQERGPQGGARPNSGGGSSGSAVSRPASGSGGGSGSTSSSSGSGSSSSAGSSSAGASRPSGGSSTGSGESRAARPERRIEGRAVPRGSSTREENGRVAAGGSTAASAPDAADGRRRAVPAYSRPRDGRPTTGTAVERNSPPFRGDRSGYYYDPFYRYSYYYNRYPYGYYYPGYGFGVGYFYDPWMWGSFGGYDPYYYGGSGSYSRDQYRDTGNLRLKVKPNHGQVFVDGYFAGEVDSFDGVFQKLNLDAGAHRIEIRAEGYEPVQFEVMVTPGETVTYKGDLKRVQ